MSDKNIARSRDHLTLVDSAAVPSPSLPPKPSRSIQAFIRKTREGIDCLLEIFSIPKNPQVPEEDHAQQDAYVNQALISMLHQCGRLLTSYDQSIENGQINEMISSKFHAIELKLFDCETILEAITTIDNVLREEFPEITPKIILTPCFDDQGIPSENPVAQMLVDSMILLQARETDRDTPISSYELVEKQRLLHLAELLPIME